MMAATISLLLLGSPAWAQVHDIPDHQRTPGAINPAITHDNIFSTVCVPSWTKSIRPPASYIAKLKLHQMRELGQPGVPHDYHEDHIVPLCLGGHPTDPRNLWPQPLHGQWADNDKNQLEQSVCRMLCLGDITLEAGQAILLAPDWR
jgi:hypothetical protein